MRAEFSKYERPRMAVQQYTPELTIKRVDINQDNSLDLKAKNAVVEKQIDPASAKIVLST